MRWLMIAAVALGVGFAAAQVATGPQVEAVSIKSNPSAGLGQHTFRIDPSHLSITNISLENLLTNVYGLKTYQLEAPEWTKQVSFDVEASFSGAKDAQNLELLLQPVVAQRFKLKYHSETRNGKVYRLDVVAQTAKLRPATEHSPPFLNHIEADGYHLQESISMARFADFLSGQTDRPVIDRTNLAGNYEIKLDFIPDSWELRKDPPPGPTLNEALREQLGLKLEVATAPIQVMVVDHVERAPVDDN